MSEIETQFKKKSLLELRKLTLEELKKYYFKLRKYEYDNNIPLKGIEIRKKIHKLLLIIIKIDRILSKKKLTIIGNKMEISDRPKIFAATHGGPDDVQIAFEAIKEHGYIFFGDPEDVYQRIEGLLAYFNGSVFFETRNKEDRKIAYDRSVELLKANCNILICPEGAWNITPNLPVMKLYEGAAKMAYETGADIVPLALEQYGNQFYANVGSNMRIIKNGSKSVAEINDELRDNLATLKWDIWEYQGVCNRSQLPQTEGEYINQIMSNSDFIYSVEDIRATMYKDKNIVTAEEVFSFRKTLR